MVVLAFRVTDWDAVIEVARDETGEWRNGLGIRKESRSVSTKYPPSMCFSNPSDAISLSISGVSELGIFGVK